MKDETAFPPTPTKLAKTRIGNLGGNFNTLNLKKQMHSEMQPTTVHSQCSELENVRVDNHTAQDGKRTKKFINKNDFDELNNRLIDTPLSLD